MSVFDDAKKCYTDGLVKFAPATEEDWDYALGVVPPHRWISNGFLMGEPWSDDSQGNTLWYGFFRYPNGNFACALMTEEQFLNIVRPQVAPLTWDKVETSVD